MVAGSVGSGKSSLLRVFLNEIIKTSGSVKVNGQVSYVSQQAWIANIDEEQHPFRIHVRRVALP